MDLFIIVLKRVLGFVVFFGLGVFMITNRMKIVNWTGDIGWLERNVGSGSTYFFWVVVGGALCVFAFIYMFGLEDGFVKGIFSWIPGF